MLGALVGEVEEFADVAHCDTVGCELAGEGLGVALGGLGVFGGELAVPAHVFGGTGRVEPFDVDGELHVDVRRCGVGDGADEVAGFGGHVGQPAGLGGGAEVDGAVGAAVAGEGVDGDHPPSPVAGDGGGVAGHFVEPFWVQLSSQAARAASTWRRTPGLIVRCPSGSDTLQLPWAQIQVEWLPLPGRLVKPAALSCLTICLVGADAITTVV